MKTNINVNKGDILGYKGWVSRPHYITGDDGPRVKGSFCTYWEDDDYSFNHSAMLVLKIKNLPRFRLYEKNDLENITHEGEFVIDEE